jgi:hypothetical protein
LRAERDAHRALVPSGRSHVSPVVSRAELSTF